MKVQGKERASGSAVRTREVIVSRSRAALIALGIALTVMAVSAPAVAARQRTFATPEQAVDALIAAARNGKVNDLLSLLGLGSRRLVSSGDDVADAQSRSKFVGAYDEANEIAHESDERVILNVGKDEWPFPFPIVKRSDRWQFDSTAGAAEILDRRIGANELDTIEVCRAYVDAQREYAEEDRNHDGFIEYAQKFLSSPGKQDGLYWPTASGEAESPIGPLMVNARAEGYSTEAQGGHRPYHGYYYRILKGQGPMAKGGAFDYVVKGHMIGGFALIAFPSRYRASGVMTFIVNHDGMVYQKDLGPNTALLARRISLFNPDSTWTEVP